MEKGNKTGMLAKTALLTATLIWGSTFFILKNTLDSIPTYFILAFRFLMATAWLSLVFWKKLKKINKIYLLQGAVLGIFLAAAYIFQTIGLKYTTPGKNAFLTAIYCVLVPFFYWAVSKNKPDRYNVIAACICIAGVGLVSLDGNFSIQTGDWLTLIGGVFYALHIVCISLFNKDKDAVLLTILQFFFTGLICLALSLCTEKMPSQVSSGAWLSVLYLAFFGTAVAMLLQNVGQKYTSASSAAIILSLEAVFGALFSVIFYREVLSLQLLAGFAMIFIAVIISETKLSFLKRRNQTPDKDIDIPPGNVR